MSVTITTDANGRLLSKCFTTAAEAEAELWKHLQEAYAEIDRLRAALHKQETAR